MGRVDRRERIERRRKKEVTSICNANQIDNCYLGLLNFVTIKLGSWDGGREIGAKKEVEKGRQKVDTIICNNLALDLG